MALRLLLLLSVLCVPAIGQDYNPLIEPDAADASQGDQFIVVPALKGVGDEPRSVGGLLLLAEDAEPTRINVGCLYLGGDFDVSTVAAMVRATNEVVDVIKISEREYVVNGCGEITLWISTVRREPLLPMLQFRTVMIPCEPDEPEPDDPPGPGPGPGPGPDPDEPEPEPEPDDPPAPPVPEDRFDNLGQRVAAAVSGASLENVAEVAGVYFDAAESLTARPLDSQQISIELLDKRRRLIESDSGWQPVVTLIAREFNTRYREFSRGDLIDFWYAVAAGLGRVE
jgi:hypothetical protein